MVTFGSGVEITMPRVRKNKPSGKDEKFGTTKRFNTKSVEGKQNQCDEKGNEAHKTKATYIV